MLPNVLGVMVQVPQAEPYWACYTTKQLLTLVAWQDAALQEMSNGLLDMNKTWKKVHANRPQNK